MRYRGGDRGGRGLAVLWADAVRKEVEEDDEAVALNGSCPPDQGSLQGREGVAATGRSLALGCALTGHVKRSISPLHRVSALEQTR